jgi:hypothetical protein
MVANKKIWLAVVFLLSAACAIRTPSFLSSGPKVINHPAPALTVDTAPFQNAGCGTSPDYQPCDAASPLGELGCANIRDTSPLLGGLTPAYPMVYCITRYQRSADPPDPALFHKACLAGQNYRLALSRDGQTQLVNNLAELQAAFAPIETPDEALSYAMAASGFEAQYGYKADSSYRYKVQQVEDTHVDTTGTGYVVHLFDSYICGCGPHAYKSVDVTVTRDGQIEVGQRQPVSEDPKMDGLCID